jgi:hypothetical protein
MGLVDDENEGRTSGIPLDAVGDLKIRYTPACKEKMKLLLGGKKVE